MSAWRQVCEFGYYYYYDHGVRLFSGTVLHSRRMPHRTRPWLRTVVVGALMNRAEGRTPACIFGLYCTCNCYFSAHRRRGNSHNIGVRCLFNETQKTWDPKSETPRQGLSGGGVAWGLGPLGLLHIISTARWPTRSNDPTGATRGIYYTLTNAKGPGERSTIKSLRVADRSQTNHRYNRLYSNSIPFPQSILLPKSIASAQKAAWSRLRCLFDDSPTGQRGLTQARGAMRI